MFQVLIALFDSVMIALLQRGNQNETLETAAISESKTQVQVSSTHFLDHAWPAGMILKS
jgi:hypothetical protein